MDHDVEREVAARGAAVTAACAHPRVAAGAAISIAQRQAASSVMSRSGTQTLRSTGALRLGQLCVHLDAPQRFYLEDLSEIYWTKLHPLDTVPRAELTLEIVEAPGRPSVKVPEDSLVIASNGDLYTETMFAEISWDDGPPRVKLTILDTTLRKDRRHMYLVVLLNKIFFRMGYVRLHASAIVVNGATNVFIGDRGAGKSSICAYLAGRCGLILADDDVMMHYDGTSCLVSGCDERMRIMPDTEAYLFGQIDVEARKFGGFMKKEIVTADRFETMPYVDHRLTRVFFPKVGDDFAITPLSASQLVMRLMTTLVSANRFAGVMDHAQTLKTLSDIADRVSTYDVTLSRDFTGLDRLFEFLSPIENES